MPNYFYFDQNGQKQGPVDDQQLQTLASQGIITQETSLEIDTGLKGTAGQIPGLSFEAATPPPLELASSRGPLPSLPPALQFNNSPDAKTIKNLKSCFSGYWIGMAIGYPLLLVYGVGLPLVIWSVILGCMLHYKLWKLIPADIARATPGKAVGYMFIPIFNFYWCFVSISGLCKDMNKTLKRDGIQYQVDEKLGVIVCLLFILTIVTMFFLVGIVIDIVMCVVEVFLYKSLLDGAIALHERKGAVAN